MKIAKILSLIALTILIVTFSCISAFAFSNDIFEFTPPADYTLMTEGQALWANADGSANINITISPNDEKASMSGASAQELKKFEENITVGLNDQLQAAYGEGSSATINGISTKLDKVNTYDAIVIDMDVTYSISGTTVDVRQFSYNLSSKNHIYNITLTMFAFSEAEYNKGVAAINTFMFKDELLVKENPLVWILTFAGIGAVTGGIVGLVVGLVLKAQKKKKLAKEENSFNIPQ